MSEILEQLQQAVIVGQPDQAGEVATQALAAGIEPLTAIEEALNVGMQVVGDKFERDEYFIPDLMMATEAMKAAMKVFEPVLMERQEQREVLGTVVIGTVAGDIHEIGKSLVATMLSAAGFQVHDLGVDVPVDEFEAGTGNRREHRGAIGTTDDDDAQPGSRRRGAQRSGSPRAGQGHHRRRAHQPRLGADHRRGRLRRERQRGRHRRQAADWCVNLACRKE